MKEKTTHSAEREREREREGERERERGRERERKRQRKRERDGVKVLGRQERGGGPKDKITAIMATSID